MHTVILLPVAPAPAMTTRAARQLAAEWGGVLNLDRQTERTVAKAARILGEQRTRDVLADTFEFGGWPVAELIGAMTLAERRELMRTLKEAEERQAA